MKRQIFLAAVLIALPVALFAAWEILVVGSAQPVATATGLGDLSAFTGIVTDVQSVAQSQGPAAAKTRIADLEKAWDDAEATLRPKDQAEWGKLDGLIDDALSAARADTPDPAQIDATLTALLAELKAPTGAEQVAILTVDGVAVTDSGGHALPCETMIATLKDHIAAASAGQTGLSVAQDNLAKALERCNAQLCVC